MFEYLCTGVYIVGNVDDRQLSFVVHIGCALNVGYARPQDGRICPWLAVQKDFNASNDRMIGV